MSSSLLVTSFIGFPPMCTLLLLINYDEHGLHLLYITKFSVQLCFIDCCNSPIVTQTPQSPIWAPLLPSFSWFPTTLQPEMGPTLLDFPIPPDPDPDPSAVHELTTPFQLLFPSSFHLSESATLLPVKREKPTKGATYDVQSISYLSSICTPNLTPFVSFAWKNLFLLLEPHHHLCFLSHLTSGQPQLSPLISWTSLIWLEQRESSFKSLPKDYMYNGQDV